MLKCDQVGGYRGPSGRPIMTKGAAYYDQLGEDKNATKWAGSSRFLRFGTLDRYQDQDMARYWSDSEDI